jgi:hypothetical protein
LRVRVWGLQVRVRVSVVGREGCYFGTVLPEEKKKQKVRYLLEYL